MGTTAKEHLDLQLLDPGYRVFFEPKGDAPAEYTDVQVGREKNLDLFEQIEPGSRAGMEKYLDSATETYEIAKKYFLYTAFARLGPILKREVVVRLGTLARLLLTKIWGFAGRSVKTMRAKQILGYPAVFLGTSPYEAPAMFHLMSHLDLVDGVLYAQGGFTRVMDSIRDLSVAAGVDVRTNARVSGINVDANGHTTGVTYTDKDGNSHVLEADIVVSGADLHHTETTMLPEDKQTFPESWWENKKASPGEILLYLGVKGDLPNRLQHSLFFT